MGNKFVLEVNWSDLNLSRCLGWNFIAVNFYFSLPDWVDRWERFWICRTDYRQVFEIYGIALITEKILNMVTLDALAK